MTLQPQSVVSEAQVKSATKQAANVRPWDAAHAYVDWLAQQGSVAVTEPDVVYPAPEDVLIEQTLTKPDTCRPAKDHSVTLCDRPSPFWPSPPQFGWHLNRDHSQLADARAKAAAFFDPVHAENDVLIAHIDTGFNPQKNDLRPANFDEKGSVAFLDCKGGARELPSCAECVKGVGHGVGTLSVLAGNKIRIDDAVFHFDDYVGGAPFARVVSYKVGNSPVSLQPCTMAAAINYAVDHGADVISMAHGGPPSIDLLNAVNNAYEHGVAMIFASGDFIHFALPIGRTPHTTVYPARFNRAISVVGVTADHTSYGKNSWLKLFRYRPWPSWKLRGSYGPRSVADHTLAAYTPNVPRERFSESAGDAVLLDLDFAGTSAATPQVAATAALWLQMHRNDAFLKTHWHSWEKAEAVYQALLKSVAPVAPQDELYFGRGFLRAADALDQPVEPLTKREPSRITFNWLTAVAKIILPAGSRKEVLEAHQSMLQTEMLQIAQGNTQLRKLMAQIEEETEEKGQPNEALLAKFRSELASDPRKSVTLTSALDKAVR